MTIVLVEVAAFILTLIAQPLNFMSSLGLSSLYLLWNVLLAGFLLCRLRQRVAKDPFIIGVFYALIACLLAFCVTELVAQYVLFLVRGEPFQWARFMSLLAAASLISLLILRLFTLLGTLELRHKSEAEARVQALQSRIRPHFLFNAFNTIAELTVQSPSQAEQAIESLSTLFRASMDKATNKHSLDSEIHLCQRYLQLERWRLNDHLQVVWENSVSNPRAWQIPKLILQPLVENAVVHGRDAQGNIEINIDIKETKNHLSIRIMNNINNLNSDSGGRDEPGNGIAMDNIRERLFVLYDDRQAFKVRASDGKYQVIMRIPKEV